MGCLFIHILLPYIFPRDVDKLMYNTPLSHSHSTLDHCILYTVGVVGLGFFGIDGMQTR